MSLNLKPVTLILLAAHDALMCMGWTQGHYARTDAGRMVLPLSKRAGCFCALGAIESGSNGNYYDELGARKFLTEAIEQNSIDGWNDWPTRTKDEVLAAFLRAAELAEAAE